MFFKSEKIMRYISYFVITGLFVTNLCFSSAAFSEKNSGHPCEKATSTSAVVDCVNKKKQNAQDHMGETYRSLMDTQEGDQRQALSESQKNWILYRDAHCKWEASLSGTAALDRAYELSCVTQLTQMRERVLKAAIAEQQEITPREFGDQPRWMNVLTQNYPDIFWRFGEWVSADLNCDGTDEKIMTGLSVAHINEALIIDHGSAAKREAGQEVSLVVAISYNPDTGIPEAVVHKFSIDDQNDDTDIDARHFCRPSVNIAVEGDSAEETCGKTLVIDDKLCPPVALQWDGSGYVVVDNNSEEGSL